MQALSFTPTVDSLIFNKPIITFLLSTAVYEALSFYKENKEKQQFVREYIRTEEFEKLLEFIINIYLYKLKSENDFTSNPEVSNLLSSFCSKEDYSLGAMVRFTKDLMELGYYPLFAFLVENVIKACVSKQDLNDKHGELLDYISSFNTNMEMLQEQDTGSMNIKNFIKSILFVKDKFNSLIIEPNEDLDTADFYNRIDDSLVLAKMGLMEEEDNLN